MTTREHAFERLVAANPLADPAHLVPDIAEAQAFLRGIEEGLMDTRTKELLEPIEPQRRLRGLVVAVAAFVAMVALVGVVAFVASGGEQTTVPPATSPPPVTRAVTPTTSAAAPTTLPAVDTTATAEQLATANLLADTFNAGDLDAYMALFAENVVFSFPDKGGPDVPQGRGSGTQWSTTAEKWRAQKTWEAALGGTLAIGNCSSVGGVATCSITYGDFFVSAVMGSLEGTVGFVLNDDAKIIDYRQDWGATAEAYDGWAMSFDRWLEANYPSERSVMALNLGLDPLHTDESARLWLELGAEWLAAFTN